MHVRCILLNSASRTALFLHTDNPPYFIHVISSIETWRQILFREVDYSDYFGQKLSICDILLQPVGLLNLDRSGCMWYKVRKNNIKLRFRVTKEKIQCQRDERKNTVQVQNKALAQDKAHHCTVALHVFEVVRHQGCGIGVGAGVGCYARSRSRQNLPIPDNSKNSPCRLSKAIICPDLCCGLAGWWHQTQSCAALHSRHGNRSKFRT